MAAAESLQSEDVKLATEHISEDGLSCIRFKGTIDEEFDGAKFAQSLRAKTLILDLGQIQRISSFGIREWSEFIRAVEKNTENILIIECSPKIIDQINMVAGFVGKALVYSFYGPYRCDYCDIDDNQLFQVDKDSSLIRALKPIDRNCGSCSREMYFDEDPATYFGFVASQPHQKLQPEVANFLSTRLDYQVAGTERAFQVHKWVNGSFTYFQFKGRLDGSFPSRKLSEGLEGHVVVDLGRIGQVDLAGAAEWRNFMTLGQKNASQISLIDCPPSFISATSTAADLGSNVVSLRLPYSCNSCGVTASNTIDVASHHELLSCSTPPVVKCSNCSKSETQCIAPEGVMNRLKSIPKPKVDSQLKSFIKTAQNKSFEKKSKPLASETASGPSNNGLIAFLSAAIVLVVLAIGVVLYSKMTKIETASKDNKSNGADIEEMRELLKESKNDSTPAWVTVKTPQYATCADLINRISCMGISPYTTDKEMGGEIARDAALEEMFNAISLKISDKRFDEKIRPLYDDARKNAILAYDEIQGDKTSEGFQNAQNEIQSARKRARLAALSLGGGFVPLQPSGTYWEKYEPDQKESKEEFLVFVNYEIGNDAIRKLIDIWTTERELSGSKGMTAFPLIAWGKTEFVGGVLVTESKGVLAKEGVAEFNIVTHIDKTPVHSVGELNSKIKDAKHIKFIK